MSGEASTRSIRAVSPSPAPRSTAPLTSPHPSLPGPASPGKPEWLWVKAPQRKRIGEVADLMRDLHLNTVCAEASCPNFVALRMLPWL